MKPVFISILFLVASLTVHAQKFPLVSLQTIDNKSVSSADIVEKTGLVVISFWATWCIPCINELDAISEVYDDWHDELDFSFYAIATDDARTKNRIRPMVKGKAWPYDILIDDNQDLKRGLNITAMPHVVVMNNGEIVYQHTGYTQGAEEELFETLKNLSN